MALKDLVFAFDGWGGVIIIVMFGVLSVWYALSLLPREDRKFM